MPANVYVPPLSPGALPSALVFVALVLFFSSRFNGYIKRVLRHPQMAGTLLWAMVHLLANGDIRSLALFGSFEIVLCNRRDGPRTDLPAASGKFDLIAIIIGGLAWGALGHFHVKLFGVAPM